MHCFWRAAIAVVLGIMAVPVCVVLLFFISKQHDSANLFHWIGFGLIPPVLSVVIYGLLTRRYYRLKGLDNETRCRECQYILRGITEPRCPECGERI